MNPTTLQKRKGYYIRNNQITFVFAEDLYPEQLSNIQVTNVAVRGSFTHWKKSWPLTKANSQLWKLKTSLNEINIPGNSGRPEFRFIINSQQGLSAVHNLSLKHKFYDGYRGEYKNIILLPEDNPEQIKKINNQINTYKTNYPSPQELANFRAVPINKTDKNTLYRSYHPFIKSKPGHPREEERIQTVQELIKKNNINSIINLSDTQEQIPNLLPKYRQIIDSPQNIIFVNQDHEYDIYYYSTSSQEFTHLLQKIVSFLLHKQPPFLIHCRIGTDRTGVIAAILAAFLGVNWSTISNDYKQSNNTGIKEYRDPQLLHYTFNQLLGGSFKPETLEQEVTSYFKNELGLTSRELKTLKAKLTNNNIN